MVHTYSQGRPAQLHTLLHQDTIADLNPGHTHTHRLSNYILFCNINLTYLIPSPMILPTHLIPSPTHLTQSPPHPQSYPPHPVTTSSPVLLTSPSPHPHLTSPSPTHLTQSYHLIPSPATSSPVLPPHPQSYPPHPQTELFSCACLQISPVLVEVLQSCSSTRRHGREASHTIDCTHGTRDFWPKGYHCVLPSPNPVW